MAISLTINGTPYDYPQVEDEAWGEEATNWAEAVTNGMLQKAGGNFTLTADVNFGNTYGLKSLYYKTNTSNIASSGEFRLAKTDTVTFRNNANSGDLELGINGSDQFTFNGSVFLVSGSIVNADVNASAAIAYSKLNLATSIVNGDISGSAAIAYSKLNLATSIVNGDIDAAAAIALSKLAAVTASKALVSDGSGFVSASSVTSTELGYLSGATSSVQTQLTARLPLAGGTMSGAIEMSTYKITGLGTPTVGTDAATKTYVDNLSAGIIVHTACRVATTVAGTLASDFENGDTIDGVVLATNDRLLIKNQAAPAENGIYTVNASGAPTRATDADTWDEMVQAYCLVSAGTTNINTGWKCDAIAGGTLNTTAINWAQFSVAPTLTAGTAIDVTGTTISVKYDNSTIGVTGDQIVVKTGGITNTQINSAAAIDWSKMANLTNSRALVSDGSGDVTVATTTATEIGYVNGVTSAIQTQLDAKPGFSTLIQSSNVINVGFSFSVAASALTINLKQADGSSDCTSTGAAHISFRSSTLATGSVLDRTVTGALSMDVTSGATLGGNNAVDEYLYLYAIDNAGTVELAISASYHWDEGQRYSTTAMSSSADDGATLYSTTARTNVAIRLLGRIKSNQTTAGTWAAVPTEVCGTSFTKEQNIAKSASFNAKHGYVYLLTLGVARTVTLPTPRAGLTFKIKDVSGTAYFDNITIARFASEQIEGVAASKTLQTNWGSWTITSDGTNWYLI